MRRIFAIATVMTMSLGVSTCAQATPFDSSSSSSPGSSLEGSSPGSSTSGSALADDFNLSEHGSFDEGWAMSFLPGTPYLLISERGGALQLRGQESGRVRQVSGTPEVYYEGQGGLHDVIPGPTFEEDGTVYLSWAREHPEGAQGVVGRGTLDTENATLNDLEVIWEQAPTSGEGHFALRLLVYDGFLHLTSGDRQKMSPAQELDNNLGATLRLTLDGEPAPGNPWDSELWTIGHRNPLGIAADGEGNLWVSEMGPRGGDELNLLVEGSNYGWPEASMGVHYDGSAIPDHSEEDGFQAPSEYWAPSISPGSLLIYQGDLFPDWQGTALVGGLSGQNLVHLRIDAPEAAIDAEWDAGARVRALAEAPDGAIWVLEDGAGGRLLELRPQT
ncbi:PQQ-dependent sugar dehydrogenase [Corynebacterium occultum]|nr:PQQ-dependent sugar dehydrogenase [Corynebacterium occultum]